MMLKSDIENYVEKLRWRVTSKSDVQKVCPNVTSKSNVYNQRQKVPQFSLILEFVLH